jgi:hypothetical protein
VHLTEEGKLGEIAHAKEELFKKEERIGSNESSTSLQKGKTDGSHPSFGYHQLTELKTASFFIKFPWLLCLCHYELLFLGVSPTQN